MAYLFKTEDGPKTKRSRDVAQAQAKWPNLRLLYDGKDDENYLYKTLVLTKYTGITSATFAAMDIALFPRPNPGLGNALSRIKFYAGPIVGGGLAYTSAVLLATNLRGKNDQYNHMYGGAAWGIVIGKCARCFITGSLMGLLLGFTGFILKDCAMHDMWPDIISRKRFGGAFHHKYDMTMVPDRQGYWVRSQEEESYRKLLERGQV